ncbi:hypothetical protein HDU67_005495 [Dinochytrium kinnereticum]|nr:hypothetical protein HDU67_005495 [Dinochytrium kinnereticum]
MADLATAIKSVLTAAQGLSETPGLDLSTPELVGAKVDEVLTASGKDDGWTVEQKGLLGEVLVLGVRAALDHLPSVNQLVQMFERDDRIQPRMHEEATKLLLKASKMDHADSQIEFAKRLIEGKFIKKDDYEAIGWLVSAARTATAQASVTKDLATLLLTSSQLPPVDLSDILDVLINGCRDAFFPFGERASVETWEKYAMDPEFPDPHCMHELAGIYATGEGGVQESSTLATHFYIKSAKAGSWKGLSALSDLLPTPSPPLQAASQTLQILGSTTPLTLPTSRRQIIEEIPAGVVPDIGQYPGPEIRLVSGRPEVFAWDATGEDDADARGVVEGFLNAADDSGRRGAKGKLIELVKKKEELWLKRRAEGGDLDSMVAYASIIENVTEKKSWLQKAVDGGNAKALYAMYELAGDADPAATEYLKKAAEMKLPQACFKRGQQLEKGTFWEDKNFEKAREYYEMAGDHAASQYRLSLLLLLTPTAYTQTLQATRSALLNGSVPSCAIYGARLYWEGKTAGGPWIERAKDRGGVPEKGSEDEEAFKDVYGALEGMEKECRGLMGSVAGVDLVGKAREGNGEAQMAVARLLKGIGYPGIATTVFLGNLENPITSTDARYEVARAFHFGIGDIHRNLIKAVCWYYASAQSAITKIRSSPSDAPTGLRSRGAASSSATWTTSAVLSLLALADLYETGVVDILSSAPVTDSTSPPKAVTEASQVMGSMILVESDKLHALPKDTHLSTQFRDCAKLFMTWSETRQTPIPESALPRLRLPIDYEAFIQAEAKNGTIRQHGAAGVLRIGEVDELIRLPEPPAVAVGEAETAKEVPAPPVAEISASVASSPPVAVEAAGSVAETTQEGANVGKKKKKPAANREPGAAGCCVVM